MELLITRQVVDTIVRGVQDGQRDALEYGGSLLAVETSARTLVAYALPTGPAAEQSATRLCTDADYQNTAIARVCRELPSLRYVGDWHVHPMWLPRLSATDRRTAARILEDDAHHKRHLVLLLGTARRGGEVHVLGFIARPGGGEAEIEARPVRVVGGSAPEVVGALGRELPSLREVLAPRSQGRIAAASRRKVTSGAAMRRAPAAALDLLSWPLRALERAVGTLSYQPLLAKPLLLADDSSSRCRPPRSPMNDAKIYKLRTKSVALDPSRNGAVVVAPALLERLRALGPEGTPVFGRVTGEGRLRVDLRAIEADEGLKRVGWAWARAAQIDPEVVEEDEVTIVAEEPARATRNARPLEVVVLDPLRYRDRVQALPGVEELCGKRAVLIGLGSVGSDVGARLARLGVRVVGCDPDHLAVENLIRWGPLVNMDEEVGREKAEVWVERLRATIPGVEVEAHALDVVREAAAFDALLRSERPDLLICATDTADSRRVVNAAAARYGAKALYVALADGAASVRLEIVDDASRGPCHLCAELGEGIAPAGFGGTRRSRTPYASETRPAPVAVAALPVDAGIGAALAARVALLLLTGVSAEAWFVHGEQRGNVMFMSLQPDTWVFQEPWSRLVYQVERDPSCPVCGDEETEEVDHV